MQFMQFGSSLAENPIMKKSIAVAAFAAVLASHAHAADLAIINPGNEAAAAGSSSVAPERVASPGAATSGSARIRLFGRNGFMVDFFENSTCLGGDARTSVSGSIGSAFSSFLGKPKNVSLGIKDTPNTLNMENKDSLFSKGYFREYKVVAGQPLTLKMSYGLPRGMSCGPIGTTFTPQAGKDYEAILDVNSSARRCTVMLKEVQVGEGGVVAEVQRMPATKCETPVFADGPARTIQAQPGKMVCHRETSTIGGETGESRLCVTQGNFKSDWYVYSFNNQPLIQAIDDQTTVGVSATYKESRMSMTCTPQLSAPAEPTPAQLAAFQTLTPDATPDQVKLAYMRMHATETGRQCEVRANDAPIYSVQVKFD